MARKAQSAAHGRPPSPTLRIRGNVRRMRVCVPDPPCAAAPPVPPARPAVRPCPPRQPHFAHPALLPSLSRTQQNAFPLGAAPPLARHSAFRSSTASSTSRLVERPFDARPVNRFISRGIFAPSRRAPPLPARSRRRYDKAPKFSRSRVPSFSPPLPPLNSPRSPRAKLVRGRKRDWRTSFVAGSNAKYVVSHLFFKEPRVASLFNRQKIVILLLDCYLFFKTFRRRNAKNL